MYEVWLGEIKLPVAPEKITISTGSLNETVTLVEGGEINLIRSPKLRTIAFEALIPNTRYPFASYLYDEFKNADYYKDEIAKLKESKKVLAFVITRVMGNKVFNYTGISATLEDYRFTESAHEGYDLKAAITLKEYRTFGAIFQNTGAREREAYNAPSASSHTVVSGESLWLIAKKYYGDGSKWRQIYDANKNVISDPNKIKAGMNIVIP